MDQMALDEEECQSVGARAELLYKPVQQQQPDGDYCLVHEAVTGHSIKTITNSPRNYYTYPAYNDALNEEGNRLEAPPISSSLIDRTKREAHTGTLVDIWEIVDQINRIRLLNNFPTVEVDEFLMLRSKTTALRIVLDNSTRYITTLTC